jgi:hypothetical protein
MSAQVDGIILPLGARNLVCDYVAPCAPMHAQQARGRARAREATLDRMGLSSLHFTAPSLD